MSRATVVYLAMIVVFIAGLWGVLSVGGRLRAPDDLDGRWAAVGPVNGTWTGLTVEQSGRYFELAFDNGPRVSVTADGASDGGQLSLSRGAWHVMVGSASGDATRAFRVDGPRPGTFVGRRERPTKTPVE